MKSAQKLGNPCPARLDGQVGVPKKKNTHCIFFSGPQGTPAEKKPKNSAEWSENRKKRSDSAATPETGGQDALSNA